MNLRNVGKYNIGLDMGTASVGWAVTDEDGELLYHNGKPTWGSRLFPEAEKASEARSHRSLRRRYNRRKQRLDLLQTFFQDEIEKVDSDFFNRLQQSYIVRDENHPFSWHLFLGEGIADQDYYKKFPTIYHLRAWLMNSNEKADIRYIFLALHNIVKHRGNFLQQDNKNLSAAAASVNSSVEELCVLLQEWSEAIGLNCAAIENAALISEKLSNTNQAKSTIQKEVAPLFAMSASNENEAIDKKQADKLAKAVAAAIVGLSAEMADVFFINEDTGEAKTKIYISKDEDVEAFSQNCPDEGLALFTAMQKVYSSFVLQEILSLVPGGTISENKIAEYERYKEDLKTLKSLVCEYKKDKYDEFFRGALFPNGKYNTVDAKGYTKYNAVHGWAYDEFKKEVEQLFKGSGAENDPRYIQMIEKFGNQTFLRRLKTSDNGAIPFQLHLEEMNKIIENQKQYYPFLEQEKEKLNSLVTFRIPYYVGPLTLKNARRVNDKEDGDFRFAWSVRKPGMDNEKIYPWNWEEVIDKNASAEKFITRMTGTCTYLYGEPVLPKSSLLYEEFCVLNELNGAHYSQDGDDERRFSYDDRSEIIERLFKRKRVSYKDVVDYMRQKGHASVSVKGGQGETGFESKLSSYIFFTKDVLGVDELTSSDYEMAEQIILWSTLFEDRDILEARIKEVYGDRLNSEQIKKIRQKRFTGWGKMSQKFLSEMKVNTDNGMFSIMEILREGNPNNGAGDRAMVMMEILHDDKLKFKEKIESVNAEAFKDGLAISLDELPGSPAIRRSINQAIKIVDEIASIAGHNPENIFIEVTRSDDDKKKGKRTTRRLDAIKEQLRTLKEESPEFWNDQLTKEINKEEYKNLNEKLTLYFMQAGKSLYSGKPLDINRLSEYQVDHIIPQSYMKDDSVDNKALVLPAENQNKSNQMLIDSETRSKMKPYWKALHHSKLMSDKKFNNLMRSSITEGKLRGFINRQIVETSQSIKNIQLILSSKMPETKILPVKAGISSELREPWNLNLPKCREINDFHHAHDALLACEIGRFIQMRFDEIYTNPMRYAKAIQNFIRSENDNVRKGRRPYSSPFIVSSFMRSGFDKETGEIERDTWNAEAEIEKIRRYFDYKQCHITRMPEETSGAFWDATIYSPYDPSKGAQLKLPLKKGLDPKKYGSYSREQFAYFFVYKALKKGKEILELAPVPVSVAAQISQHPNLLAEYAMDIAVDEGMEYLQIIRPKIYKYQLIDIDGSRMYITGKKEIRNGVQVALKQDEVNIVKRIIQEQEDGTPGLLVNIEELVLLFQSITNSILTYSPRLANALNLGIWDDEFDTLNVSDKELILLRLLSIAAAKTNMIDLVPIGGSKNSGCMLITYPKLFATSNVCIIDQSVTGMFERRDQIGL